MLLNIMTVDKKKKINKQTKYNKDGQTLSTAPWCGHRRMHTFECFQCDRIEGIPGVLRNKVKKGEIS